MRETVRVQGLPLLGPLGHRWGPPGHQVFHPAQEPLGAEDYAEALRLTAEGAAHTASWQVLGVHGSGVSGAAAAGLPHGGETVPISEFLLGPDPASAPSFQGGENSGNGIRNGRNHGNPEAEMNPISGEPGATRPGAGLPRPVLISTR